MPQSSLPPNPSSNPYARFAGRDLTLNDHLAIDRTVLANERTLLAYGRTALAMLIIGGSAIKFFQSAWMLALGIPFLIGAGAVTAAGLHSYTRVRNQLRSATNHPTHEPPPAPSSDGPGRDEPVC